MDLLGLSCFGYSIAPAGMPVQAMPVLSEVEGDGHYQMA